MIQMAGATVGARERAEEFANFSRGPKPRRSLPKRRKVFFEE